MKPRASFCRSREPFGAFAPLKILCLVRFFHTSRSLSSHNKICNFAPLIRPFTPTSLAERLPPAARASPIRGKIESVSFRSTGFACRPEDSALSVSWDRIWQRRRFRSLRAFIFANLSEALRICPESVLRYLPRTSVEGCGEPFVSLGGRDRCRFRDP